MAQTQQDRGMVSGNSDFSAITSQWKHSTSRSEDPGIVLNGGSIFARAANFVVIHDMIKFLEGPRPKEGTPERATYDEAIQGIGGGEKETTIWMLKKMHGVILIDLSRAVHSRQDLADENLAESTERVLLDLSKGVGTLDQNYAEYLQTDVYQSIARLYESLSRTSSAEDAPLARRSLGVAESPVYRRYPDTDQRRVVFERVSEQQPGFYGNASLSDSLVSAFGGNQDQANQFLESVLKGYKAIALGESTSQAVSGLQTALANLKASGSRIADDPAFKAAEQALSNGDLKGALQSLYDIRPLQGLWQNLDKFTVVTMDNLAFTYLDVRGMVEIKIRGKEGGPTPEELFERARAQLNPTSTEFFGFTKIRFGAHYKLNQYYGRADTYELNPSTAELTRVSSDPLSGLGHVITAPFEAYMSGIVKGMPYHIVLYTEPGVETWKLDEASIRTIDSSGQTAIQKIKLDDTNFHLGPTGLEFQMPGTGERRLFSVQSVGLEFTGSSARSHFVDQVILYTRLEGTAYESGGFAIMGRARVSAALNVGSTIEEKPSGAFTIRGEPVNFVISNNDGTFLVGPVADATYEITGSEAYRHMVHWGAGAHFAWVEPKYGVQLGAGFGYGRVGELGPSPHGGFTGSLNVTVPFGGGRTAPAKAVEARDIPAIYGTAVEFAAQPEALVNGPAGQALAQQTAAMIDRNLADSSDAERIRTDVDYKAAIIALREGDLESGVTLLRKVAEKYPTVFTKAGE
ncbi:MAG: hypothetical protein ABH842_03920 [Candidatus Micrarchaeota archaeon]